MFEAFGLAALALAAIGVYGLIAGDVGSRMREIGIRCALGASRAGILGGVMQQGLTLTAAGIGVGLAGSIAGSRAIASLLFSVSPLDAVTLFGVALLLLGVSALASLIPACRAASMDPSITLRVE